MREYHEVLTPIQMEFGIAISNCANEVNPPFPLPASLKPLLAQLADNQQGVEIQFGGRAIRQPFIQLEKSERDRIPFIGVHLPISNVDFSNPSLTQQSIESTQKAFEMAQTLRAEYAVAHLQKTKEWDRI